jgi:hypothetical protein
MLNSTGLAGGLFGSHAGLADGSGGWLLLWVMLGEARDCVAPNCVEETGCKPVFFSVGLGAVAFWMRNAMHLISSGEENHVACVRMACYQFNSALRMFRNG